MVAERVSPEALQPQFDRLGPWTTKFRFGERTYGGGYEVGEDDRLLQALQLHVPGAQRVLELGCMEGGRTFPLARRVGHVLAVDIRREHLERARFVQEQMAVPNVTFLELDLEAADLATLGRFDVAFNVGLLYHLADPARLLRQLAGIAPAMLLWTYVVDDADAEVGGYSGRFVAENPTDRVGGVRSKSFRPTRAELIRMLGDCGWRDIEWLQDEGPSLTLWCRTKVAPRPKPVVRTLPSLAVIVTCHNYGHFLDECLQSVLNQSRRPDEVLVVDDASSDNTPQVVARWSEWGVKSLRVEYANVRLARLAGFNATNAEFVCFLDADDRLAPDYLRNGVALFDRYDVGFVYSDAEFFGDQQTLHVQPETIDAALMSRLNYVHNGAIVRREALEMTRALEIDVDPAIVHEDWLVWRKLLEQGWQARKQRATYGYRRHVGGVSRQKQAERTYCELRGLMHETVTLCIPLSGRVAVWPRFQQFLEQQTWPHRQVQLVLLDTSQNERFGRRVRRWISQCDYRDVRYLTDAVAELGLADADRRLADVQGAVRMAAARIYNRFAREVTGPWVMTLEDDVIPPNDVIARLMQAFEHDTASVAAPYPSRFHEGYVAWNAGRKIIQERGTGVQTAEGNGFGCTLFRGDVFRKALFTARQPPYVDFDPAFYERLKPSGMKAKLCWEAECQHLENNTAQIMLADHWPESWETLDLAEYRSNLLAGREACRWIVDTLNGPSPAAIWSLSDGDIAWWCYDALYRDPEVDWKWLDQLAWSSGLHPEDREALWPLFDQACRNASAWLVQYCWEPAERFTLRALKAQGVTVDADGFGYARDRKKKVDCNAVYRLLDEGLFWSLVAGKRLAIVSGHAEPLRERLTDEEFVRAHLGDGITWSVVTTQVCPPSEEPKHRHCPRILDALASTEWDLLLCSAGALSAVLCEHVRQAGRKALDIGSLDQQLLRK